MQGERAAITHGITDPRGLKRALWANSEEIQFGWDVRLDR